MLTVVIVENDSDIAQRHSHFINKCKGFNIVGTASTIELATQLVAQAKPDLVIVDNNLPDGQGVDLVYQWLNAAHQPECILVTAASDAMTVQLAHSYGAFDYIVKPVDYTRLIDSLERFAHLKHLLTEQQNLHQAKLDGLFHSTQPLSSPLDAPDLFKLKQVIGMFPHANVELSAHKVATELGVSEKTATRYLDKAVEQGEIEAFVSHGEFGRPTRLYRGKTAENL